MAERPGDRQWTRRGFMGTVDRAGHAQGMLKTFTASHSVSRSSA